MSGIPGGDPGDHPAYRGPNYARLFAEAVRDSIVDNFPRDEIEPGFYLVRAHAKTKPGEFLPLMAAKIWMRDGELAGEILGVDCDPVLIWTGRDRLLLFPQPPLTTPDAEYRYQVDLAAHMAEHEPENPLAWPRRAAKLTALPPIPPPPPRSR